MVLRYLGLYCVGILILASASDGLESDEALIVALMEHFQTKHLYLIGKINEDKIRRVIKLLTRIGVYVSTLKDDPHAWQAESPKSFVITWEASKLQPFSMLLEINSIWTVKWLIFTNETSPSRLEDIFIPINCEFLLAKKISPTKFQIDEVYRLRKHLPMISRKWGEWQNGQLLVESRLEFLNRRSNLMGIELQLAEMVRKRKKDPDEMFQERMVHLLGYALNFTEKIKSSEIGVLKAVAGQSTGVYKCMEEDCDIACLPFAVTPERLKIMQFMWPTATIKTYLFMTSSEENDWKSFLKPFEDKLWFMLGGWIVIATILLNFHYKICDYHKTDAYLDVIRPFCVQGNEDLEQESRVSLFISRNLANLIAMVVYTAYSAAILSFLAVPTLNQPFQNLDGFIANGRYKLTFVAYSFPHTYFTTNENDIPTVIRERNLISDNLPFDLDDAYRQICENRELVYVDNQYSQADCHVIRIQNEVFSQSTGLAVKKYSPFRQMGYRMVRRIHMSGLMALYQKIRMPKTPRAVFKPLELDGSMPIFLLTIFLVGISLMILCIELLVHRISNRKQLSKKQKIVMLMKKKKGNQIVQISGVRESEEHINLYAPIYGNFNL